VVAEQDLSEALGGKEGCEGDIKGVGNVSGGRENRGEEEG
jgi:hypothetical protein